jgi:hypothetical protein
MKFPSKVFLLPPRLYYLYLKVVVLSALARMAVVLFPFRQLARGLTTGQGLLSGVSSEDNTPLIEEIGLAVTRVARFTPWRCMCLEQGLIAKALLWQKGISSTLVFGVASQSENKIIAHAWLHCGQKVVTGEKGMDDFQVIASFT